MMCRRFLLCFTSASLALGRRVQEHDAASLSVQEHDATAHSVRQSNNTMLNDDNTMGVHIICPVLGALVQNGDMLTHDNGSNVDADTVLNSLLRAGLNQPAYSGETLPAGITQSNAFEYTLGIFLKNKAANYRDSAGSLTLPIGHFRGTNHEHNSHTGITTGKLAFDKVPWDELVAFSNGSCWSRDAWAKAMKSFEMRAYNGNGSTSEIDNSVVRSEHPILGPAGTWGGGWAVSKILIRGAENGNDIKGKRLVAGVSQVMNGMINLFWTGDYGNLDLYKERAKQLETKEGKAGLSFPWLDENFCLPVDELKTLLKNGTYPASSGYAPMAEDEYKSTGKVFKFPKSRCKAVYFLEGAQRQRAYFPEGYEDKDACINGEPPLVDGPASKAERALLHHGFGE